MHIRNIPTILRNFKAYPLGAFPKKFPFGSARSSAFNNYNKIGNS